MYSTSVHANCYHGLKTNMRLFCWGVHSLWEQCSLLFLRLHTPTNITFSSLISTGNGYWSASWMKWQWQLFRTDNSPHWVITTSKGTQPLCNQPYTSRSFIYFWMNKYQLEKSPLNSFLTSVQYRSKDLWQGIWRWTQPWRDIMNVALLPLSKKGTTSARGEAKEEMHCDPTTKEDSCDTFRKY